MAAVSPFVQMGAAQAGTVGAASLNLTPTWTATLPDTGSPVAGSSPSVATLDGGGPSVVVGDRAGHVYALHLSNGSSVAGWPASTGGIAVDSTPSSSGSTVFVGAGNAAAPFSGGYMAFGANGARRWYRTVRSQPTSVTNAAVSSSLAVGDLGGTFGVVGGAIGQLQDALNASNGAVLSGFPWFEADSNFSSPALADVYSNGQTDIVEGGDSTAGLAYGIQYQNGGHVRVLSPNGHLLCQHNTDQVVQSSPAVGEFLSGGHVGIAVGTGRFWPGATTTDDLLALDPHCNVAWTDKLDGFTNSSPALADALGNGQLQVAEGTDNGTAGSVYLLDGPTGHLIWRVAALGRVMGGIVTADLGGGYQDLIVATTGGLEILNGKTGAVMASERFVGLQNSALVTKDPNGTIGITMAGYDAHNQGIVEHFEVAGSRNSRVYESGAWPMFHHDPQLTGDAGTPAPVVGVPCRAPTTRPRGYYMAATDGGLFTFGNVPFCGSTGNLFLDKPVVGMATTPNAGGYWLTTAGGAIYAFGNAVNHGSTGNVALAKPVVAMAATSNGGGYWLVATDGGIFAFGNAAYHGSTGAVRLAKPIVGMATDPRTGGYWLVASDGGIFAFDAPFYGSTGNVRLAQPIVGMTATPDGRGYFLVARDGGIFTFGDAKFHGSTGNIRLNKPILGMTVDRATGGYWMVASDGGIFAFDAPFYGSTGNVALVRPIVTMAGF